MPLFHKIIDEAATIPLIEKITITGLGEPLLDKHIVERVRYVREKMPRVYMELYTNGSYLTPDMTDALVDAGISTIYVSMNAVDDYQRREIMKLDDYEQVKEYIRYAMDKVRGGPRKVIAKSIVTKDLMEATDTDDFASMWGGRLEQGGSAFLHLEGNWAGAKWPMRVTPRKPCSRALSQIMVLQDGRVSLCCFDGEGDVIFGDLNTQTIREVFNGERATEYRRAHIEGRRGELELCRTCTAI